MTPLPFDAMKASLPLCYDTFDNPLISNTLLANLSYANNNKNKNSYLVNLKKVFFLKKLTPTGNHSCYNIAGRKDQFPIAPHRESTSLL